jgi:hypothetical protein
VDPLDVPFGGHRLPMLDALLRQSWQDWRDRRAIFGDWLEDCDDPERFAVRACWAVSRPPEIDRKTGTPWLFRFSVQVERFIKVRKQAVNEAWLLGFAPHTLRVVWTHRESMTAGFTWVPARRPSDSYATDRGEFVWLFTPWPKPGGAGTWFPD